MSCLHQLDGVLEPLGAVFEVVRAGPATGARAPSGPGPTWACRETGAYNPDLDRGVEGGLEGEALEGRQEISMTINS